MRFLSLLPAILLSTYSLASPLRNSQTTEVDGTKVGSRTTAGGCTRSHLDIFNADIRYGIPFCHFYYAIIRTRTPIPGLSVQQTYDVCECILEGIFKPAAEEGDGPKAGSSGVRVTTKTVTKTKTTTKTETKLKTATETEIEIRKATRTATKVETLTVAVAKTTHTIAKTTHTVAKTTVTTKVPVTKTITVTTKAQGAKAKTVTIARSTVTIKTTHTIAETTVTANGGASTAITVTVAEVTVTALATATGKTTITVAETTITVNDVEAASKTTITVAKSTVAVVETTITASLAAVDKATVTIAEITVTGVVSTATKVSTTTITKVPSTVTRTPTTVTIARSTKTVTISASEASRTTVTIKAVGASVAAATNTATLCDLQSVQTTISIALVTVTVRPSVRTTVTSMSTLITENTATVSRTSISTVTVVSALAAGACNPDLGSDSNFSSVPYTDTSISKPASSSGSSSGSVGSISSAATSTSATSGSVATVSTNCPLSPIVAAPTEIVIADTEYQQFYMGCGYIETQENPGNAYFPSNYPPFVQTFNNSYTATQAVKACAMNAYYLFDDPDEYLSFDLHFISSDGTGRPGEGGQGYWECVQYFSEQLDSDNAAFFNVARSNVTIAYGYSSGLYSDAAAVGSSKKKSKRVDESSGYFPKGRGQKQPS